MHHYKLGELSTGALEDFDVILMRKDPPFDLKFFFATHLLSLVNEQKCFVMNHPKGLREANEKLYALRFPEQIPQTLVSSNMERLKEFMRELGGEMIIKPLDGSGGSGVYFVGLDVIGGFLTEVNVTSPTGIQEINALNGVHLESQVIDFIERETEKRRES